MYTAGKWSDSGEHIGPLSTQIQCYKAFAFCDVATATTSFGDADTSLTSYDILRWDDKELIAVDSSPTCEVDTIRFDLVARKVSISSSGKGANDPICKGSDTIPTAYLWGESEIVQDAVRRKK